MKREMEAYIVLLHLVSQGWAKFSDIRDLLGWDLHRTGVGLNIIAHINQKLIALSEEWGEDVPYVTAFVFLTDSGECSDYICENVFGHDERQQPSPRQIAAYAKKIADYPNWNKVLAVFREEAFQGRTEADDG